MRFLDIFYLAALLRNAGHTLASNIRPSGLMAVYFASEDELTSAVAALGQVINPLFVAYEGRTATDTNVAPQGDHLKHLMALMSSGQTLQSAIAPNPMGPYDQHAQLLRYTLGTEIMTLLVKLSQLRYEATDVPQLPAMRSHAMAYFINPGNETSDPVTTVYRDQDNALIRVALDDTTPAGVMIKLIVNGGDGYSDSNVTTVGGAQVIDFAVPQFVTLTEVSCQVKQISGLSLTNRATSLLVSTLVVNYADETILPAQPTLTLTQPDVDPPLADGLLSLAYPLKVTFGVGGDNLVGDIIYLNHVTAGGSMLVHNITSEDIDAGEVSYTLEVGAVPWVAPYSVVGPCLLYATLATTRSDGAMIFSAVDMTSPYTIVGEGEA